MADSFTGVVLSFDKQQYNQGDSMILTLSGQATSSAGSNVADSPSVTVTASDGTSTTLSAGPVQIAISSTTNLDVTMTAISDGTRQWVIAAGGKSATATA